MAAAHGAPCEHEPVLPKTKQELIAIELPIHDPVLIFAVVMLIVLIAPLVFARMRVPGLVGLIVCGALVGPSGLGLLERDSTIILLGTVGLLYLMFVAGLALDLDQFHRLRSRSVTFGLGSFLVPLAMGVAAGTYLLGYDLSAALLLGSIVGSHTLLAYPVASRLGITKNKAVVMTMGGTIVTDTLALLLLAVVAGAAGGALGWLFWLQFLGLIAVYLALVLVGLPRLSRWFLRSVHGDPNVAFTFLVTALFVTAYLADLAGLAPIIGAFLAGLVLNRLVPEIGPLMSRVKFVGETLFIPFFLLSVGMLVDFGALVGSLDVWLTAAIFTSVVLVGKGIAAAGVAGLYRHTAAEGWTIFGLATPQAAATLAVTLVGFELGLFGETAVNAVVVMILVTCLLGPWVVERYGRRVALQEKDRPYQPSEAPQRILIPLSNPSTADALVDVALAIRRPGSDEPVFPVAVVRGDGDVAGQVATGEKLLSHAVVHTVAADVPVTPMTRVDMDVARGISRAVAERRISHVVIGWGGMPSPRQRIFGSILDRLLEVSPAATLVCRLMHPISTMQRVVLVVPPLAEREPGFDEAVRSVKRLASRIGTSLVLIVVHRHRGVVEEHLHAARPEVAVETITTDAFGRILPALAETLTENDLVVLLNSRESQRSWQPALDRLPRLFAARFPEADFITLYPSTAAQATPVLVPRETASLDTLPPACIISDVEAASLAAALHTIVEGAISDEHGARANLVASVLGEEGDLQEELAPGIVLLHAHTPLVDRQMLFAGFSDDGLPGNHLSHPVRLALVLLNPADLSPEAHLRTLAHVARAAHALRERAASEEAIRPQAFVAALAGEATA